MIDKVYRSLAASLLIMGCHSRAEPTSGDMAVLDGADGNGTMTEGQAPTNLPAYAPLYPGAKILSSVVTDAKTGPGGVLSFTVKEKPATIIAFYERAAKSNKLTAKIGSSSRASGKQVVMLSEPDTQRSLVVSVALADNDSSTTNVDLVY